MYGQKIQLIDVGRNKFNGEIKPKNEDAFYKEIKKHLRSSDIEWIYDDSKNEGTIFVGGFRNVGHFKVLKEGL